MKLWSDYEGRTIAEAYPLKKLVRPEGRSAFFLTTNGTGTPALVRIIEAHFDEASILERWKAVADLGQENLLTMRRFGQTELDGTPLVYAVMEPTEISLAELLENRTLTNEEARELAWSLLAALTTLHQTGLVHGQITPENILAAGEAIKLRSDCVREVSTYPDSDGPTLEQLKAADAHALAQVLLLALTGRNSLQGSSTLLPSPFDGIIRNGLSGRWGIAEMNAALGPRPKPAPEPVAAPAPTPVAAAAPVTAAPTTTAPTAVAPQAVATPASAAATAAQPAAAAPAKPAADVTTAAKPVQENLFGAAASPVGRPGARPATASDDSTSARAVAASLGQASAAAPVVEPAPNVRRRIVQPIDEQAPNRTKLWIAVAAAVVLVLVLGWRLLRSEPTADAAKPVTTLSEPATTPSQPKPAATRYAGAKTTSARPAPTAAAAVPAAAPVVTGGAGAKTVWRVVAFTYNRQDQAQQKASTIAGQHPGLRPEVFSPSGNAPYLVTLGGAMSHDQAEALKSKARGQGLPRDIYTQNYSR